MGTRLEDQNGATLQVVMDKTKTVNEKNTRTAVDSTADDIQEARDGGGDDAGQHLGEDREIEDEDEHGGDRGLNHQKMSTRPLSA